MNKQKRKLTPAQKAAKKMRKEAYMTVFMKGKQKHVKRTPTMDGMSVEDFIQNNTDPVWLHQNGMWEHIKVDKDDSEFYK